MTKPFSKLLSPTVLLYIYLTLTTVAQGIYFASGIELPEAFTVILPLGYLWIVGWWLREDSRKHGVVWVYDMGLFLNIAWLFILPYYLLKTRGAKGLLVIFGFVAAYIGAFGLGAAIHLAATQLNS
jgi:hypothetical protein